MAKSNLRRIYPRKSVTLVCFEGRLYGNDDSMFDTAVKARVAKMKSDGGKARVTVTQKVGTAWHTETWRTYTA